MKLDFIEIGTSDFRTLANSTGVGISIEPIRPYFDNLPHRKGLTRLNVAISDKEREAIAFYCDPEFIRRVKLPGWLKGCNSIDKAHPSVYTYSKQNGIKYEDLVKSTKVQCITLKHLFESYNIEEVDFLKIDTEGHDYKIMKSFFELKEKPLVKKIQFESNALMTVGEYADLMDHAKVMGYKIELKEERGNQDTILTL